MSTRYVVYLMGFEPPEMPMARVSEADIETMMNSVDFVMDAPEGIRIGQDFASGEDIDEIGDDTKEGRAPAPDTRLRCIEHRFHGKVIVAEEVGEP